MIPFEIEKIQNENGFVSIKQIQNLLVDNLNIKKIDFIKKVDKEIYNAITEDKDSVDISIIVEHASPYLIELIFTYYKQEGFVTDKIDRKIKWCMSVDTLS